MPAKSRIRRVITVAKHCEEQLHLLAEDAVSRVYITTASQAYQEVMHHLIRRGVQFIDHELDIDDLPDQMAHWYLEGEEKISDRLA